MSPDLVAVLVILFGLGVLGGWLTTNAVLRCADRRTARRRAETRRRAHTHTTQDRSPAQ